MEKFIISTDSGCDLAKKVLDEFNIRVFLMQYNDGEKIYTDTMKKNDIKEFYENMRKGIEYKTSAINEMEAYNYLCELLKDNLPIVHITLGSGISSTYYHFVSAKNKILSENPNAEIYIVDSRLASTGYGMLALDAAMMRNKDKSIEEIISYLEENKTKINTYYTTNTLTYLRRGGRVSKAGCIIGNVLSIKPILKLDNEGHLIVETKAHGKKASFNKIKEFVKQTAINPEEQVLYICHSDAPEEAESLGNIIQAELGFKSVFYTYIGSIIGSHAGPGLVAVFYHGTERK